MSGLPATSHGAYCLRAALEYAALGWHVLPVHGIQPDGSCTCGDRHDGGRERTRGKHPVGRAWQTEATTDEEEIGGWWERSPLLNVGCLLGPTSGVIDTEYDTAEGEATVNRLCAGIITPSYRSGRSVHRYFKWSPHLPAVTKLVVQGAEGRFGNGGRGAMSVLPPSRHWSGQNYAWLPGMDPTECELAEIPDGLLMLFTQGEEIGYGGGGSGNGMTSTPQGSLILPNGATRARQALILETISEGGRNETLHAFACREAYRSPNIGSPHEQGDLLEKVAAVNERKCRPPLEAEEVRRIVESAINYALRQPSSGTAQTLRTQPPAAMQQITQHQQAPPTAEPGSWEEMPEATITMPQPPRQEIQRTPQPEPVRAVAAGRPTTMSGHGLRYAGGQWHPGEWSMSIVCGDPPTYRLHVPAWRELTDDQTGDVLLSHDEFLDAAKMARRVLMRTKSILLGGQPRAWSSIWNGTKDSVGLQSLLLAEAKEVPAPPSDKALLDAAEILLDACDSAPITDEPDESGQPSKVLVAGSEEVYEVWMRWAEFWRRPIEQGRASKAEAQEIARCAGFGAQTWRVRTFALGRRKRFLVLDADSLARLRRLVE